MEVWGFKEKTKEEEKDKGQGGSDIRYGWMDIPITINCWDLIRWRDPPRAEPLEGCIY